MEKIDYDHFLTKIYDYSPYFGKERREKEYATSFYLQSLKNVSGRILEFVSCTGLLTIPLSRAGYKIDSVDISRYMHECIMDKLDFEPEFVKGNIVLHRCNVFNYQTVYKYEAIVLPDSFLLAISDQEQQINLLKHCNSLLAVDGILVFDFFKPWQDVIFMKELNQCSRFRLETGELFIVNTHHIIDPTHQLHTFKFSHSQKVGAEPIYQHTITYRYIYEEEIRKILTECGYEIVYLDKKFNFDKYFSVVARKVKCHVEGEK